MKPKTGTADEEDFSLESKFVTFQPGETENKIVEIDLIDDDVIESTENFTVELSSSAFVVFGNPSVVRIYDNDGKCDFCSIFFGSLRNLNIIDQTNRLTIHLSNIRCGCC